MCGNGCPDWHDEGYYAQSPTTDPQGPETGSVRVRRGGSWHTWAFYARCSYRNWNSPQTRYTLVGMRLSRQWGPSGNQAGLSPGLRPAGFTLHQSNPSIKTCNKRQLDSANGLRLAPKPGIPRK